MPNRGVEGFHFPRDDMPIKVANHDCNISKSRWVCSLNGATVTFSMTAASNELLAALPSSLRSVARIGYYATGDSPPLQFTASPSPCPIEGGDGGSQVPTRDGKCWLATFPDNGLDVTQFGAKCDGTTDDSRSIQRALDALRKSKQARLLFPGGTCVISSALSVPQDSISVIGNNLYGTRLLQRKLDSRIFSVPWSNIQISDFRLDYDGTPVQGADAIYTSGANNIFDNLYIYRAYRGIAFESMSGGFAHHIQIWRYVDSALFVQNAGDIYVDSFIFNADSSDGRNSGIRIQNRAEAVTISNGDILGGEHSLTLDSAQDIEGRRPAFSKFTNVYFDSSREEAADIKNGANLSFVNDWFSGGRPGHRSGLRIDNSTGVSLVGSIFFNNGLHGAEVTKSARDISFTNCQFVHNSTSIPGQGSGIFFQAGASDFVVSSNILSNNGYDNTQSYGVYIENGYSDRYVVTQNLVSGNQISGIKDLGKGKNRTVSSNY